MGRGPSWRYARRGERTTARLGRLPPGTDDGLRVCPCTLNLSLLYRHVPQLSCVGMKVEVLRRTSKPRLGTDLDILKDGTHTHKLKSKPVPRRREKGIGTRRKDFEKDFSTEQYLQKENPRVQDPHEDKRGKAGPEEKASQGKKAADCLIRERADLRFPRSAHIRSRADYLKIQRSGRKTGGRYLIFLSMDNDLPLTRFGITVSRKTGNAVIRNRIKRRIRELQRYHRGAFVTGKDIVVIARREASTATFEDMRKEYRNLAEKAGLARRLSVK